ncbi:hypothetical protein A3783_15220 [Exiguobacterium undae]|uniref:Uncharacterized protein n=1 Tax=Exiguobacterium undae TaxID=169177 RepID=A0ABX2V4X1_9BACL|nr:hypothetical protein A3783_15220 [Exiguobacterium undae]
MNIAHDESSVEFCVVTLFYTRPLWVFLCFQLGVALNITIRLIDIKIKGLILILFQYFAFIGLHYGLIHDKIGKISFEKSNDEKSTYIKLFVESSDWWEGVKVMCRNKPLSSMVEILFSRCGYHDGSSRYRA